MKLVILGGGGARMPAFVQSLLAHKQPFIDRVTLFEPDPWRRQTMCALAIARAGATGLGERAEVGDDIEAALDGADFVFSAVRVGGDQGRVFDEQVALERGLVGQETVGAGGAAMALRTVPVVLNYCRLIEKCAPRAVLINFTNPAGLITQAISTQTKAKAVGVCDTPSATMEALRSFLRAGSNHRQPVELDYAGLNHLGWVSGARVAGRDVLGPVLENFGELQAHDPMFRPFDAEMVRRLGAVPTEYLYYYYEPGQYIVNMSRTGRSRGQQVSELNQAMMASVAGALARGDTSAAWYEYEAAMGHRHSTYMSADTGRTGEAQALAMGGYERLALAVVEELSRPRQPGPDREVKVPLVLNVKNSSTLGFLAAEDIVEVPVARQGDWFVPRPSPPLPLAAMGLVAQVKAYERLLVDAAVSADAGLAAIAMSFHPLVPGLSEARELLDAYITAHGPSLAYLAK